MKDKIISYLLKIRRFNERGDFPLKEWKLVYLPANRVLKQLVEMTSESLHLDGVVGVNTDMDLEELVVTHSYLAGIAFKHPTVNHFLRKQQSLSV